MQAGRFSKLRFGLGKYEILSCGVGGGATYSKIATFDEKLAPPTVAEEGRGESQGHMEVVSTE